MTLSDVTPNEGGLTTFDYLLNRVEHARDAGNPKAAGYAEKRRALYEHVRELERLAAVVLAQGDSNG